MRKVCFLRLSRGKTACLGARLERVAMVLYCLSCFSKDCCDSIIIDISHICKTGFGILRGFLLQLRALVGGIEF